MFFPDIYQTLLKVLMELHAIKNNVFNISPCSTSIPRIYPSEYDTLGGPFLVTNLTHIILTLGHFRSQPTKNRTFTPVSTDISLNERKLGTSINVPRFYRCTSECFDKQLSINRRTFSQFCKMCKMFNEMFQIVNETALAVRVDYLGH